MAPATSSLDSNKEEKKMSLIIPKNKNGVGSVSELKAMLNAVPNDCDVKIHPGGIIEAFDDCNCEEDYADQELPVVGSTIMMPPHMDMNMPDGDEAEFESRLSPTMQVTLRDMRENNKIMANAYANTIYHATSAMLEYATRAAAHVADTVFSDAVTMCRVVRKEDGSCSCGGNCKCKH